MLGCTHYPLLADALKKFTGPKIRLVDSARNCAIAVKALLKKEKIAAPASNIGKLQVALTDKSDGFLRIAEEALGLQIGDVQIRAVQNVAQP